MLPEFKASSKRLNMVCNLETEKEKGHLRDCNEHINTSPTHSAKLS